MKKERLDVQLVNNNLVDTREKARRLIMTGQVFVNGNREEKPGTKILTDSIIEVKSQLKYVSRGGLKLEKAIKAFKVEIKDKVALDIGSSTGGFSDCLLQNGAKKIVAVDVGYGQLAWKIRSDSRVKVMERTNIRYVKPEDIGFLSDLAVIDVSFISLKIVLPAVKTLLNDDGKIICLIKPQFEAGKDNVGKNGVVRDFNIHNDVIRDIIDFSIKQSLFMINLDFSPIKGAKGNIEYLLFLGKKESEIDNDIIPKVIDMAKNI